MIQLIQCQQWNTDIPVNFHRPYYRAAASPGTYGHMALWMNATSVPEKVVADILDAEEKLGLLAG